MNVLGSNDRHRKLSPEQQFYRAVRRGRGLKATDPRDKLFAFCALPGSVEVDYLKSVRQLYCDFERQYLKATGYSLIFLCNSGTGYFDPNPHMLPSWTHDLSRVGTDLPTKFTDIFAADYGLVCDLGQIDSKCFLKAYGSECGAVLSTEATLGNTSRPPRHFIKNYGWSKQPPIPYPTGVSRQNALIRTLALEYDMRHSTRLDVLSLQGQAYLLSALGIMMKSSPQDNPLETLDLLAKQVLTGEVLSAHSNSVIALAWEIFKDNTEPNVWNDEMEADKLIRSAVDDKIFHESLHTMGYRGGRYFHTKEGYLGWGPPGVKPNDSICVLRGCSMPVVLRAHSDDICTWYEHVGGCFVLGYMDGEAAIKIKEGTLHVQEFEIR
jgi:hypothetical protein